MARRRHHRRAAGVILLVGVTTCGLGSPRPGAATRLLATLGLPALVLGALALATASLTPLSLLVVDVVALWAVSTVRHVGQRRGVAEGMRAAERQVLARRFERPR